MSDNTNDTPRANPNLVWRTQLILFGALVLSTVLYAGTLFMILQQPSQEAAIATGPLLPVFGVMSASLLVGSYLLRRKLLPPLGTEPAQYDANTKITEAQQKAIARVMSANIIGWAMSEAIAIFGFMLGFLGRDVNALFPFLAMSWVAFGLNRPSREVLDRAISGATENS